MDEVSLAKRGGSVSAQSLAYPKRIEAQNLRISQLILCMAMDTYLNFDKVPSFRTKYVIYKTRKLEPKEGSVEICFHKQKLQKKRWAV